MWNPWQVDKISGRDVSEGSMSYDGRALALVVMQSRWNGNGCPGCLHPHPPAPAAAGRVSVKGPNIILSINQPTCERQDPTSAGLLCARPVCCCCWLLLMLVMAAY